MNINLQKTDPLNGLLKVKIAKEDYEKSVNEQLKKYKKEAVIPGFRKGFVPMGFLKKKYEKGLVAQKIQEILQSKITQYIADEKLELLGGPLPKTQENFSWETKDFIFEFELGFPPEFTVNLNTKNKIEKYKIIADETFIQKEIEHLKEKNEKKEWNQEFFDTIFGKDAVKNETELKTKIKKTAEENFAPQSDQHFLNSTLEYLVENTKFQLPKKFLKKWLQHNAKEPMNEEKITKEYEKLEKSLQYQLVESQILKEQNIKIEEEELKNYTKNFIKKQMAIYGQQNISEEELTASTQQILKNKKETQRLEHQLTSEKLLVLFQEKINYQEKEINYEDFVKKISENKK